MCLDPSDIFGQQRVLIDGQDSYQIKYKLALAPGVFYIYCKHCKCVKPPRAHHCSVLDKCVYNMDHYCPWMANCVGLYNYRYFYLFLLYMAIGCAYCIFVSGFLFLEINHADR